MDNMDSDVCCPQNAIKLIHSLTHPSNLNYVEKKPQLFL